MEMKNKLAIFDMDGTLFDTGEVNFRAYRDALLPYGIVLNRDYFVEKCNGRHYTEFLPSIMRTDEHLEAVHRSKKNLYAENLQYTRVNTHLIALVRLMRQEYYTAIVTTASQKNTYDILEAFSCKELFDLVLTQENIEKVKPDPQGFLKAMEYFGMQSSQTVIFEDSDVGLQAAEASGATVFKIVRF